MREYGFHPRTKASVEDGALLPRKFEPFPQNMYGKPLEEIDSFIYEEVSNFDSMYLKDKVCMKDDNVFCRKNCGKLFAFSHQQIHLIIIWMWIYTPKNERKNIECYAT